MVSYAVAFAGALEFIPDINEMLQLVPLPSADLQMILVGVLVVDTALCWVLKFAVSGKNGPSAPPKRVE
jgi:cation-transporting ATPase 13A1